MQLCSSAEQYTEVNMPKHDEWCSCRDCVEDFELYRISKLNRYSKSAFSLFTCFTCRQHFATEQELYEHEKYEHANLPLEPPPWEKQRQSYRDEEFFDKIRAKKRAYSLPPSVVIKKNKQKAPTRVSLEISRPARSISPDPGLKCDICFRVFRKILYLVEHKRNFHQVKTKKLIASNDSYGKENRCSNCDKMFANVANLEKHMISFHGNNNYQCSCCPKVLTSYISWRNHESQHAVKDIKCLKCKNSFDTSTAFNAHSCMRLSPPKMMSKKRQLSGIQANPDFSPTVAKTPIRNILQQNNENDRPFVCSICDVGFKTKQVLKRHYISNSHQLKVSDANAPKRESFTVKAIPSNKIQCNECDKLCNNSVQLMIHKRLHQGLHPLVCVYCGLKTDCLSNMERHENMKHEDEHHVKQRLSLYHSIDNFEGEEVSNPPKKVARISETSKSSALIKNIGLVPNISGSKTPVKKIPEVYNISGSKTPAKNTPKVTKITGFKTPAKNNPDVPNSSGIGALKMPVKTPTKSSSKMNYACIQCSRSFSSLEVVQIHERSHRNMNALCCVYCNFQLGNFKMVYQHEILHKQGRLNHICNICGAHFLNAINLDHHIDKYHK